MRKKDVIRFLIFRALGNFLVLFTVFGFFATFGPTIYYEIIYRWGTASGVKYVLAQQTKIESEIGKLIEKSTEASASAQPSIQPPSPVPTPPTTPTPAPPQQDFLGAIISGQKEQVLVPKSTDFSIVIPKIGANERILANVDASNETEYLEALKKGVAHAKGSAFPGMKGNIYLFAHSADNFWNVGRYNAVFYLIKELEQNDEVVIVFQGKRYDYVVSEKQIVGAEDVSHISANLGKGEKLILQTCWPPGTTWKRLLVIAKPKGS